MITWMTLVTNEWVTNQNTQVRERDFKGKKSSNMDRKGIREHVSGNNRINYTITTQPTLDRLSGRAINCKE